MGRWVGSSYWSRSTSDLRRLASEKYLAILRLERQHLTYLNQQEIRKLQRQRDAIIAILVSRRDQQSYLE